MGAFFLYSKNQNKYDMDAVKKVFENKGFSNPAVFELNHSLLLLYKKQLVDVDNYVTDGTNYLFSIGTLVYKKQGYTASLHSLLSDFVAGAVCREELLGNYCVIFYSGNKIHVLNDALNVCELFEDKDSGILTSSFLAAASAQNKLTVNRIACQEKLLTGYIVGTDTLFNEVNRVFPSVKKERLHWNVEAWNKITVPPADINRKDSIQNRALKIGEYFKSIEPLAKEFKPELGLSGGYDSRLLYAASFKAWPFKLDVHTHSTEGVHIHDVEKKIVQEMAAAKGSALNIVPTHNLDYYNGDEIEQLLKDGYYFFDGRCAYNMGAFSPVYTRQYKMRIVGQHRLTLNGLGGEMYRNYFMNIKPFVNSKQWMKAKIYCNGIDCVIPKETFKILHKNICRKMNALLPFKWGHFVSNFKTRRYYSEMRMPDCDALNCNAHNQVEFYLTPFIEQDMIVDAYKGRKMIGLSGQYQADIICKLDVETASFDSHYGYTFNQKEPLRHTAYMLVRGLMPDSIWNARISRSYKKHSTNNNLKYFNRVREKCAYLDEAAEYLEMMFPEINMDRLRMDYAMMPNSSYIAVVMYELRDKIVFGE